MPKVTNLTDRGVSLFRHRLLPNSHKAVRNDGKVVEDLPAEVVYSKKAKDLHAKGVLKIEGLGKPMKVSEVKPAPEAPKASAPKAEARKTARPEKKAEKASK